MALSPLPLGAVWEQAEYPGNPLLVISQTFWLHFPFPESSPSSVLISEGGVQAPENVFNFAAICSTASLLKTL